MRKCNYIICKILIEVVPIKTVPLEVMSVCYSVLTAEDQPNYLASEFGPWYELIDFKFEKLRLSITECSCKAIAKAGGNS